MLEAATEWGCRPWVVEDEVTETWWERWLAYRNERSVAQKKPKGNG